MHSKKEVKYPCSSCRILVAQSGDIFCQGCRSGFNAQEYYEEDPYPELTESFEWEDWYDDLFGGLK